MKCFMLPISYALDEKNISTEHQIVTIIIYKQSLSSSCNQKQKYVKPLQSSHKFLSFLIKKEICFKYF